MDKTFKELNESVLSFMMNSSRQVVELNQKIWNDYVELTNNIIAKSPVSNLVTQPIKK
jgi:hypothetical protein